MKGRSRISLAAASLLCTFMLQEAHSQTTPAEQQAPAAPDTLETVVVTGRYIDDDYIQRDGNGASKLDVDIRDVPASLQTISPQLIRDQSAGQSINSVLHNASGVSQTYGSGTGNLPAVSIRGFDSGGYTLVDGYLRTNGQTYDWSSIDKIEILKGPASLLYGMQYNIGGSINVVTKRPDGKRVADVEVEAGSWDHYRTALDFGGAIDDGGVFAWRLNVGLEKAKSYRDAVYDKNLYVAPSIRGRLGESDTLLLRADLHDHRYITDGGLPGPGLAWAANDVAYWYPGPDPDRRGFDLPISQYIGLPWWDGYRESNHSVLFEWEHRFNERWKVKAGASPAWTTYSGRYSWFWWDQPTDDDGNPLGFTANHLSAGSYGYKAVETPANIDLLGEFDTGAINHKILFGAGYNLGRWHDSGPQHNSGLVPAETVGAEDWLHGPHYTLIPDPDYPDQVIWKYHQRTVGVYVQDMLSFGERWKVLVGYRFDKATGGWTSVYGGDTYTGELENHGGTPRLGVVFQPTTTLSLYASWSLSFNPNWGRLVNGSLPPPERGEQYELGLKKDFASGRMNVNLAAYSLNKKNVERCAPQDPDCKLYVLGGKQGSKGIELDINGQPVPNLRLTAALTYQTGAKVITDIATDNPYSWGALPIGDTFPGGQHIIANLFGVYTFTDGSLAGLELGAGANYSSSSEQNLPNDGYKLQGERSINLFAAYKISSRVRAQLNVNNLTSHIAYSSPGWQGWPWLYFASGPRQFILTLSTKL